MSEDKKSSQDKKETKIKIPSPPTKQSLTDVNPLFTDVDGIKYYKTPKRLPKYFMNQIEQFGNETRIFWVSLVKDDSVPPKSTTITVKTNTKSGDNLKLNVLDSSEGHVFRTRKTGWIITRLDDATFSMLEDEMKEAAERARKLKIDNAEAAKAKRKATLESRKSASSSSDEE